MPYRALETQLLERGLQILGPCQQLSHRTELLVESALLRDFTPAEAELLGASMLRIGARRGQLLIAEGEASDWLMILLRGTVDIGKRKVGAESDSTEPGDNTRLAVFREGAVIGEMSMLDGEPRYASCWALSEVEAAILSRAAVGRLISTHPAVGAKLLVKLTQLLAQRLRNTSNQLVKMLQEQNRS
jgi:CRP/FNR family transcriptional regulator, cyclic AMP receptor protein